MNNRILHQVFEGIQIFHDPETDWYYVQGKATPLPTASCARLYIGLFMAPNTDIPEELPSLN